MTEPEYFAESGTVREPGGRPAGDPPPHLEARTFAWDYFSLHAEQRMKMFNFYLIVTGAIVAAFPAISALAPNEKNVALFPLLLPVAGFLFWRLDQRTRHLIGLAEDALRYLEQRDFPGTEGLEPHVLQLFKREEYFRSVSKKGRWAKLGLPISYADSFRVAYLTFGLLGLGLALHVVIR
jgi:hypothetical protein